ncbi:MAG TPA: hypothetical protein VNV66_20815 [Pilimelia sp.]|nr:hypothetical protein [Pilimelia sp.]
MDVLLHYVALEVRDRWRQLRANDTGAWSAEMVIIVAVLATLALAIGAIIVTKVTAKANSINLG